MQKMNGKRQMQHIKRFWSEESMTHHSNSSNGPKWNRSHFWCQRTNPTCKCLTDLSQANSSETLSDEHLDIIASESCRYPTACHNIMPITTCFLSFLINLNHKLTVFFQFVQIFMFSSAPILFIYIDSIFFPSITLVSSALSRTLI